jgi:ABC-type transport system substrate-binding protein
VPKRSSATPFRWPIFRLPRGQPDRGAGAYQFTGYTIYDPLVAWEMNVADRPGKLVPGLATEWGVDPADQKKWRFTLRRDVKFHDGSSFNADAVIWNLDKVVDEKTPQFDKRQSAQVKLRLPSVGSYRKVDDYTIEITTKEVDSIFPYQMLWFLVSSPAQYEKVGRDWENSPARRQGPVLSSSRGSSRALESRSSRLVAFELRHGIGRMLPGSPWTDIRLRKALNLAIDREAVVMPLNGLAKPAVGQVDASSPWFGHPKFQLKYDLAEAKKLVKEAGYSPEKPLKTTFVIAQGGTGQMLSLPMNEFLQQSSRRSASRSTSRSWRWSSSIRIGARARRTRWRPAFPAIVLALIVVYRPTPVVVVVTSETLKLRPPDVAAVLDEIAKKKR